MPYPERFIWKRSNKIQYDSDDKLLWVGELGLDFELIKAVYFAMIPLVHPEVDLEAEIKRYNG